jgi:hypothetical protein
MTRIISILVLWSASALGSVFSGPMSTSLGGAGSAGVNILEGSHLNPATLPFIQGYHAGFLYNSSSAGSQGNLPATSVSGLGVVLTDASEEVVIPASASYLKGNMYVGDKEYTQTEIHVGMGFRVVSKLAAGVAVERRTRNLLNGPEDVEHNVTTGLLFTPLGNVGLSLVFHDMLDVRNIPMNPTTTIGAMWMYHKVWRVYADWSQPQKSNPSRREIISIGVESSPMGEDIFVRTGGRWDQYNEKRYLSAGMGWDGPNLSLDYGYEKNLDFDEYRHLVDMRLQF